MPEFTASIDIFVPPERLFEYLRDVRHLPAFTPTMTSAEPQADGRRVHVKGESHGHHYDVDGEWREDRKAMRVEWGADGDRDYGGSLQVKRDGRGSRVDAVIRFGGFSQTEATGEGGEKRWHDAAERGLQASLENLKQLLEPPTSAQQ